MKKICIAILISLMLWGCSQENVDLALEMAQMLLAEDTELSLTGEDLPNDSVDTGSAEDGTECVVAYGEYYYDVENVVLYLDTYGELPENYITKEEAEILGWQGGSVEPYQDGAAIGGNTFGNREGLLPDSSWIECDIDTDDASSRGAKRLVFSLEDDLYYYTDDHYESFTEIIVDENGTILWN